MRLCELFRPFLKRVDLGKKVDAIMHAGALHAPYASKYSEQQFVEVNVCGTANVLECGIPTVFTSTTSHTITEKTKVKVRFFQKALGECSGSFKDVSNNTVICF